MFDTICTLPLPSDLFAQSIHPTTPILALGLASGHVQLHRLPACTSLNDDNPAVPDRHHGCIETAWRTRRHKGSCRSLSFSSAGDFLFSAGTDGLVKAAATETGQVVSKIAIPLHNAAIDPASVIHALTPQTFLLATDSSALHIYDLRAPNTSFLAPHPQQTHRPHDDYISSIVPLPPGPSSTSGFSKQWISTGGTTVAVTDLRRGVVVQSEDLGEELLCGAVLSCGTGSAKVVVGGERGVLRVWEQAAWDFSGGAKVGVGSGESLDVLSAVPEGVGRANEDLVAVGLGDGKLRIVEVGRRKVAAELRHDELEGVVGVGFEIGGRMISGGGLVVKVWQESDGGSRDEGEDEAEGEKDDEDEEEKDDATTVVANGGGRRAAEEKENDEEEDISDGEVEDSAEEEVKGKRRQKKRKRNKKGRTATLDGGKRVLAFKGLD